MKKFSFLLLGAFLLWTITFALAEETKDAGTTTWTTAEVTETTVTTEAATWDTAEATETTAEATTWDTVEATETTAEATTWDTVETTWTTEATTWDTAETSEATDEATTWDTVETTWTTEATETSTENTDTATQDSAKSKYDEEQVAAYEWALEKGITTINDIEKARLSDWLTRAELAKMMSQYMTNVLWKTPVDAEKVEYADVDASLGDLADFIQTAYAYKIMWINADWTPLKEFNPNEQVTRAEYATVFSRVLYGDKYNKAEWNYYEDHLKALKEAGILTNDTPTIQEVRGWVMLMMYRSKDVKTESTDEEWENTAEATTWDANTGEVASLYTEEDLAAAEKVITEEGFGKMTVKVENVKLKYMGDEKANLELKYCQELDATVEECVVFESEFYIPEQDAQMAWAFEPDTTLTGYQWYLGRTKGGEWKILTSGY